MLFDKSGDRKSTGANGCEEQNKHNSGEVVAVITDHVLIQ